MNNIGNEFEMEFLTRNKNYIQNLKKLNFKWYENIKESHKNFDKM